MAEEYVAQDNSNITKIAAKIDAETGGLNFTDAAPGAGVSSVYLSAGELVLTDGETVVGKLTFA